MMISTKGRYALRIMLDLAGHDDGTFISLKQIATRQNISMKYLEMIVALLHKGGVVKSQRGKEGGKPGGFGGQREMQHQLSAGVGEPVFRLRQQPAGGGQILHQYPAVINAADDPAFIIKDVFPHHGAAASPFHRAELCPKEGKLLLGGHGAASFQATVVPG